MNSLDSDLLWDFFVAQTLMFLAILFIVCACVCVCFLCACVCACIHMCIWYVCMSISLVVYHTSPWKALLVHCCQKECVCLGRSRLSRWWLFCAHFPTAWDDFQLGPLLQCLSMLLACKKALHHDLSWMRGGSLPSISRLNLVQFSASWGHLRQPFLASSSLLSLFLCLSIFPPSQIKLAQVEKRKKKNSSQCQQSFEEIIFCGTHHFRAPKIKSWKWHTTCLWNTKFIFFIYQYCSIRLTPLKVARVFSPSFLILGNEPRSWNQRFCIKVTFSSYLV